MDQYLQNFLNVTAPFLDKLAVHFSTFSWITLLIFFVLLLVVLKLAEEPRAKKKSVRTVKVIHEVHDIQAIAGDDLMTTQLDLARAYIEMDNKELAKQILQQVVRKGDASQQKEAERLLECV